MKQPDNGIHEHIESRPLEPEGKWFNRPPSGTVPRREIARPLIPVHKIKDYVEQHPDAALTVPTLAALAHLSPYHFARLFRNATGQTVHKYVLDQRVQVSYQLVVTTNLPLSQIANDTGFADESHFIRHFNATFGLTPGALRRRYH